MTTEPDNTDWAYPLPITTACPQCGQEQSLKLAKNVIEYPYMDCSHCNERFEGEWTFIQKGDLIDVGSYNMIAEKDYPYLIKSVRWNLP
jgi:transcription elongation factor Elf1